MNRRKFKVNYQRLGSVLLVLVVVALAILFLTSFVKHPEQYISTWRYQLQCDIENGDESAIEYYQTNYVANGITLFE